MAFRIPYSRGKLEEQVLCGSELGHNSCIWEGQLQDRLTSWPSIHLAGSYALPTLRHSSLFSRMLTAVCCLMLFVWLLLAFCHCHLIFSCYNLIVNFIGQWKGRFSQKWCPHCSFLHFSHGANILFHQNLFVMWQTLALQRFSLFAIRATFSFTDLSKYARCFHQRCKWMEKQGSNAWALQFWESAFIEFLTWTKESWEKFYNYIIF